MGHWRLQKGKHSTQVSDAILQNTQKADNSFILVETAWIDIDYMDRRKDFTFDPVNFPEDRMIALSKSLHSNGQKFVTMVDPALSTNTSYKPYEIGHEMDVFLKNNDGTEFVGQVWPGYTVFPGKVLDNIAVGTCLSSINLCSGILDWWHPNATKFWEKHIVDWMTLLDLDGLWIDMNEPSSFCLGSCGTNKRDTDPPLSWDLPQDEQDKLHAEWQAVIDAYGNSVPGDSRNLLYPGYAINNGGGNLSERTASMNALHYGNIPHYDLHNLYGHAECSITHNVRNLL